MISFPKISHSTDQIQKYLLAFEINARMLLKQTCIQLDGKIEKVNQILKNKMSLCFPIIRNLSWRKFHK